MRYTIGVVYRVTQYVAKQLDERSEYINELTQVLASSEKKMSELHQKLDDTSKKMENAINKIEQYRRK